MQYIYLDEGNKKIKLRKKCLHYYTESSVPDDGEIIGQVYAKEVRRSKTETTEENNLRITNNLAVDVYKNNNRGRTIGYFKTDDEKYIRIVTQTKSLIALPFATMAFTGSLVTVTSATVLTGIAAVAVGIVLTASVPKSDATTISDTNVVNNTPTIGEDTNVYGYTGNEDLGVTPDSAKTESGMTYIDFAYSDSGVIDMRDGDYIPLGNNPANTANLTYMIFVNETEIYRSQELKPGEGVHFVASKYLDYGEYHLIIKVKITDVVTGKQKGSTNLHFDINLKNN